MSNNFQFIKAMKNISNIQKFNSFKPKTKKTLFN